MHGQKRVQVTHLRGRRRASTPLAGVASAVLSVTSAVASAQSAQPPQSAQAAAAASPPTKDDAMPALRFPIDDENPAGKVPSAEQAAKAPLDMGYWVMAVSDRAEAALKAGDHARAAKYFKALAVAVPDRAVAFSKLCRSLEVIGDQKGALEACRSALGLGGVTVDDHVRYVHLMLAGDGAITKSQLADADAIIEQLETKFGKQSVPLVANQLKCELGLRLHDKARLERCVQSFDKIAPRDPRSTVFGFALALQEREFGAAEASIARAKQTGLPQAAVAQMESALRVERDKTPAWLKALRGWLVPGLIGACLLVVTFMLTGRRSRKLRAA